MRPLEHRVARLSSIALLALLPLRACSCGGGSPDPTDSDPDSDPQGDSDPWVDTGLGADPACGSGAGGAPEVVWAISGGGLEDDHVTSVGIEQGCQGVVAAISVTERFELADIAIEGDAYRRFVVARFDLEGSPTWWVELATSGHTWISAVDPSSDGGTWIAGHYQGTGRFGDAELSNAGETDGFAAKLGPDGGVEVLEIFGSEGSDAVMAVAALADGGALVSGAFGGPMTVAGQRIDVETPDTDIFLARLDASGDGSWVTTWRGNAHHNNGYEYPRDIALGADGQALVVGRLATASTPGEWTDDNVAFTRFVDPESGSVLRAQDYTWGYGGWGEISADPLPGGGFVLGGQFGYELELGGETLATESYGALAARVEADGQVPWLTIIDGPEHDNLREVKAGVTGEALLVGEAQSGTDLGSGPLDVYGYVPFLAGLDTSSGELGWSLVFEGGGYEGYGWAVDAHRRGLTVIGGTHTGDLELGAFTLPAPGGEDDVWLALLQR